MRYTKKKILPFLIASGLMFHPLAQAAQLGKLEVLSGPGEPFLAQIQVDLVLPQERSSLQVKIASEEAFKAARLTIDPNLKNLQFVVQDGKQPGTALVEIRSAQPLPSGFIDTLVELTWAGGRVAREYTLTIPAGPPEKTQPVSTVPEIRPPVATGPTTASASTPSTPSATPQATTPAGELEQEGIYKVRRGDTLSEIAEGLVGDGVTLNQAMAAVYEANKSSFIKGSVHLIREGAEIRVPNRAALRVRSSREALVILAQNDDRNVYSAYARQIGVLTVDNQSTVAASTSSQGSIAPQQKPSAEAAAQADRLKIAPSTAQGGSNADASAEELLAKSKALAEANERIALLEKNVSDLQRLLDMQNEITAAESEVLGEPLDGTLEEPAVVEADTAAIDVPSETLAEDSAQTVVPDPDVVQDAEQPADEAPFQPDESLDWTPWILAGAGGLVVLVTLLLVARARRNSKQVDKNSDDEDEKDFSEVKPFDEIVTTTKTVPLVQEKAVSLNQSESTDFDLDDVLSDEVKREEPKKEVVRPAEPAAAVVPEPVDDIPELKAESEEASQQAESLSGEVKLDFPEDEQVAEKDNPIFEDLEMLEKGALSAQEELDQIRKQPLPPVEPDADDVANTSAKETRQPETDTPAEPEQATVDLDVDVPNPKVDDAMLQEVATKLDLAGAYVEIGDADGAKELLDEIVSKGDAEQVRKAKALLASLN